MYIYMFLFYFSATKCTEFAHACRAQAAAEDSGGPHRRPRPAAAQAPPGQDSEVPRGTAH